MFSLLKMEEILPKPQDTQLTSIHLSIQELQQQCKQYHDELMAMKKQQIQETKDLDSDSNDSNSVSTGEIVLIVLTIIILLLILILISTMWMMWRVMKKVEAVFTLAAFSKEGLVTKV